MSTKQGIAHTWNMKGGTVDPEIEGIEVEYRIMLFKDDELVFYDRTLFPRCIGMVMRLRMFAYLANQYWMEFNDILKNLGDQTHVETQLTRWFKKNHPDQKVRDAVADETARFTDAKEFQMFAAVAEDSMIRASLRQYIFHDDGNKSKN